MAPDFCSFLLCTVNICWMMYAKFRISEVSKVSICLIFCSRSILMMKECHHLGIRNFRTIRQPRRIELAFDLSTNDRSAPRYVVSKCHNDQFNDNHLSMKTPTNVHRSDKYQYIKNSFICLLNIIQWIFCVLYYVLKYSNCLLGCLLRIVRCVIFRYQSIRCPHHHYH